MVHGTLSDDHLIQLNVVTGTLNAQKYQGEILDSGVKSPLDLLDLTLLASSRNTKINRTSLVFHGGAFCRT